MDSKEKELLDYVRTLYERQSSKASKAGMTYWAIVAGVVYVVWHLLESLSNLGSGHFNDAIYFSAFSQVHILLVSLCVLVKRDIHLAENNELDYRIIKTQKINVDALAIVLIFFIPILYTNYISLNSELVENIGAFQAYINLAVTLIILVITFAAVIYSNIKSKDEAYPLVHQLSSRKSKFNKWSSIIVSLIFLELFVANLYSLLMTWNISTEASEMQVLAFDSSLILFGL